MNGEIAQAIVGIAAMVITVSTFVLAQNDRRRRDDREELADLRAKCERLTDERDDLERKYFALLEENSRLQRGRRE